MQSDRFNVSLSLFLRFCLPKEKGGNNMKNNKLTLRALTEGAIFVAAAQVLSMIKLFELPQGGSISLAMLPIFVYCARWGLGAGLMAGFSFGAVHMIFSGAYAWGWQSIIGDYLAAYTALGLAGLFHKEIK